ncbi:MAG: glucans biosynthesis glucosyltransferase MdoH [Pseudomonadota bacterium]
MAARAEAGFRWRARARWRRSLFLVLVLASVAAAGWGMREVLPYHGAKPLEVVILALFCLLFAGITAGFWIAVYGFALRRLGGDPLSPLRRTAADRLAATGLAPTAILFPIYHEEIERSFAGLRATYLSLAASGELAHFEFFILSDSRDPEVWLAEREAWFELCEELGAHGRIHYRRRTLNVKRKPGNVGDFLARWGDRYRYMVVLDADSLMTGATLVTLVRLMELAPQIAILQTAPALINANTLHARVQQFGSRLYGPLFLAGLAALQLGESVFWGHNAVLRVAPFMAHAGLPQLRGWGLFRGAVLSHDFVEAALLRRAGHEIWLEPGLGGSYEEAPPTLVDELTRDRRWVKGNLQHLAFLFGRGFCAAHRAAFLNGIMNYVSSLLWLAFLAAATAEAALLTLLPVEYFPEPHALYPLWPEWRPNWALTLIGVTLVVLFLPKLLALLEVLCDRGRRRAMGGALRLGGSLLLEVLVASLLAPIRMLAHARYVVEALLGTQVQWAGQNRTRETLWADALVRQAPGTLLALAWGGFAFWLDPGFFLWSLPVALPLVFAAPISVWLSRYRAGTRLRSAGWLLVPEEAAPPPVLQDLAAYRCPVAGVPRGFSRAVLSPIANALHRQLARTRRATPLRRARRAVLTAACIERGPGALTAADKGFLAEDAEALADLHRMAWSQPPDTSWGRLIEALFQAPVPPWRAAPAPGRGAAEPAPAGGTPQSMGTAGAPGRP